MITYGRWPLGSWSRPCTEPADSADGLRRPASPECWVKVAGTSSSSAEVLCPVRPTGLMGGVTSWPGLVHLRRGGGRLSTPAQRQGWGVGGGRSPGDRGGWRGAGAAMRASATAAGYFGATFCAASLIPRGDCCFAAAACRQGAKGCQRARVQTGATGAERGDVRRSRRGVRNSRLTSCTSKPIPAVYTLGKREIA